MSNQYLVEYSKRLDEIVYEVYGDLELFEDILALNSHLLSKEQLESGDIVYLLDIKSKEFKEENLKSLW